MSRDVCPHGPHLTRDNKFVVRCRKCGATFHVSLSPRRKFPAPYRGTPAQDAGAKKYGRGTGRKRRLPGKYLMENTTTEDPLPKKKSRDVWTLDMFNVAS